MRELFGILFRYTTSKARGLDVLGHRGFLGDYRASSNQKRFNHLIPKHLFQGGGN